MTDFTPSATQAAAISEIKEWFETRTEQQQVFRLFGYAGTGKTTITSLAIHELGLAPMEPNGHGGVLFGAFTGKAALVMTRKGTPARTIHSLVYRVSEATEEEIERTKAEIAKLKASLGTMGPAERDFAANAIKSLEMRLRDMYQPRFVLNTESVLCDADLLVLDEVSMVGEDMARDLLAFRKPILVLGDPGQLPPIKGEGYFTEAQPDVMLTEVHRQAQDSAILRLATMARTGEPIPFGTFDPLVCKMSRQHLGPEHMIRADQVICGTNATRRWLNTAMKRAAGFDADYPTGSGEKIICLKNRHDVGLINGMFLALEDIRPVEKNPYAFSAAIRTEDGAKKLPGRYKLWTGDYADHIQLDPDRARNEWKERKNLVETTWGYAITCHKSQGSQWQNVIVYDEGFGRTALDRNRWLYTAITRAETGLAIVA